MARPSQRLVHHEAQVDAIDLKLLAALHRHGRMPKAKLAELVNLSPTPCGLRIHRLESTGLVRGYHADIDLERLAGLTCFMVTVSLKEWNLTKAQRLEAAIARVPNIIECRAVLGDVDYMMTIVAESVGHYQAIIGSLLAMKIDEIDYTTYPVSRAVKHAADQSLLRIIGRDGGQPPARG